MYELVSILMCVYNTPLRYLEESIESILKQTYRNYEFIIVNDGSNNQETINCLEHFASKDTRIRIVNNHINIGLTRSLNIGLRECAGKYVARMDADDISMPQRLQVQVDFLDNHEDVSLVGSNVLVFEKDIKEGQYHSQPSKYKERKIYEMAMLFDHFGPAHPTFMLRRSFLVDNNIWYREEIAKAQDYAIKVDILKSGGHIAIIEDALLGYRQHEGQITNKSKGEQDKCHQIISLGYLEYVFPNLPGREADRLSTLRIREMYYPGIISYVISALKLCRLNKINSRYDSRLFNSLVFELVTNKIREMVFLHHSL